MGVGPYPDKALVPAPTGGSEPVPWSGPAEPGILGFSERGTAVASGRLRPSGEETHVRQQRRAWPRGGHAAGGGVQPPAGGGGGGSWRGPPAGARLRRPGDGAGAGARRARRAVDRLDGQLGRGRPRRAPGRGGSRCRLQLCRPAPERGRRRELLLRLRQPGSVAGVPRSAGARPPRAALLADLPPGQRRLRPHHRQALDQRRLRLGPRLPPDAGGERPARPRLRPAPGLLPPYSVPAAGHLPAPAPAARDPARPAGLRPDRRPDPARPPQPGPVPADPGPQPAGEEPGAPPRTWWRPRSACAPSSASRP